MDGHENEIIRVTAAIETDSGNATLYIERGKLYYKESNFGSALNDFNKALTIEPENTEAGQFVKMIYEILAFRHTDIYNP